MVQNPDAPQVLVGTHEVVMTLIFNVPPGLTPEQVQYKLAETVTVSVGMLSILRQTDYEVRQRANVPQIVS